jgi:uncharacterized membrane protein (UPF0127 family)
MTRRIHALLAAAALVLAACSGTTTTIATAVPDPSLTIPERLADLPTTSVTVDGAQWLVAVAQTASSRRSGLMLVTDLGSLDGMLFVFPDTTSGTFWMKDTLIPLDIAFFDDDGSLVDVLQMEPCPPDTDCPSYAAAGPYRYALEARQGDLIDLTDDAKLTLPS